MKRFRVRKSRTKGGSPGARERHGPERKRRGGKHAHGGESGPDEAGAAGRDDGKEGRSGAGGADRDVPLHRGRDRHRGSERDESFGRGRAPVWPSEVAVPWGRLLNFLRDNRDQDLSLWQILSRLGLDGDSADLLREQVALLEREGILVHHRRGRLVMRSRDRLVVGRISIPATSREIGRRWGATGAFGFVATSDPGGDLYLPSRGLAGTRHGDLVLARALTSARENRAQGSVVAILERAPSRFVGEVVEIDGRMRVRPRDERRTIEMQLDREGGGEEPRLESEEGYRRRHEAAAGKAGESPAGEPASPAGVRPGDLIVAEARSEGVMRARVLEVLGPGTDRQAAGRMIRIDLGLPGAFPPEVEREATEAARSVTEVDLRGREDFRSHTVITIDPATARDFDDAVSVESLPGSDLRLWVHIADVAHYVRAGGALDREALLRGTSVYLPDTVIPMLPHALSSGICSLVENEDRLVQSVGIDYDRDAKVTRVRFADGVIRSTARLTYEEAAAAMKDPAALLRRGEAGRKAASLLATLAPLARRLAEARIARGALDLDLPEVEFDPGKEGLEAALRLHERTPAHRLIEEFMLAANEAVARHLSDGGYAAIYRVHEPPDRGDVEEVEETLAPLGAGRKGGRNLAARLQHLLSRFRGKPEETIVAKHVLRAMKIARYADARADHFGLALRYYTHFTSPIRRYPDLVVHRALREARGVSGGASRSGEHGEGASGSTARRRAAAREEPTDRPASSVDPGRLGVIASESSRLERRAEEAERAMNDLLIAHHMRARAGEVFEGRISGATRTGVFVALEGKGLAAGVAEGFAPVDRPARYALTEPVRARLEEVDLLRGRLRLSIAEL